MIDRDDGGSAVGSRLLKLSDNLFWGWHRVADDEVEPTNNTAERALRHRVLWRKSSGETSSEWGGRFVSRLLGVVAACRQRGRDVLDFLTSCVKASIRSQPMPSSIRS